MRMTRGWIGPRLAILALGFGTIAATAAQASPTAIKYSTTGTVGSTGVTGPNVIGYNSISNQSFTTPSAFSLGEFLVAALPPGVTTTYDNTPFSVTFGVQQVNGLQASVDPITITGHLDGAITGPDQSSVVATFDAAAFPRFNIGDLNNVLSLLGTTESLVPSTTNGGRTTAQGKLSSQAVPSPEPATITLFAAAIVGLGIHHRRRTRKAA